MKKYERNNEISRNFPALKCISSDKTIDLIKYLQDWSKNNKLFQTSGNVCIDCRSYPPTHFILNLVDFSEVWEWASKYRDELNGL